MSLAETAMLCVLPLMWGGARPRVWLALMAGHFLSWAFPYASAFILLDLLTAGVVLSRPAGEHQKLIGLLSIGMAMTGIGYFISTEIIGNAGQPGAYGNVLRTLGWLQIIVLAFWGADGVGKYLVRRSGGSRGVSSPHAGDFS